MSKHFNDPKDGVPVTLLGMLYALVPFFKRQQVRKLIAEKRPKRNEPCPCGSGHKYKKCHGANG